MSEAQRHITAWSQEQAQVQAGLRSQVEGLQAQLDHMHAKLGLAYEDIAGMQREQGEAHRQRELLAHERDQALSEFHATHEREQAALQQIAEVKDARQQEVQAHREALTAHRQEVEAHQKTREAYEQAVAAHQTEVRAHQQAVAQREAEQAKRQEEEQARAAEREVERAKLAGLAERNKKLRERLLDMYSQLHAKDLPSLILQVCVNLTGSECGLFVESGDEVLAHEGFENLPEFIREALFDWTRRVADEQEPIRENDSSKLPDGSKLINLAALPVSLHSELKGVILVANKRAKDGQSEGYTDEDTELLVAIGRHAGLAMENRRLHLELGEAFLSTVAVLADAIEAKDAYTRGHCEGVSNLAVNVAEKLGFEGDELKQIRYAALLHDVGKIGVPDGILLKPGRLLPEEFSIIQRHSQIGRDLVARVPSLSQIAPIVMHHHERIDGTGYPNGLTGDSISLASRIICVADAFDAMTTPRPYRDPISQDEAIEELRRCSGTHFDPIVVDTMAQVLEERTSAAL